MFLLLRLELMLLEVGKNRKKFQAVLFRCLKTGELHYERSLSWPAPSLSSLTQGILQGPEQKAGPADRLITPNQGHPGPAQNSLSAAWSPSAEQRHKPVRSGTHLRETHPDCRFQLLLLNHTISAVLPICSNPRSKITFICQLGVERYRFLEENWFMQLPILGPRGAKQGDSAWHKHLVLHRTWIAFVGEGKCFKTHICINAIICSAGFLCRINKLSAVTLTCLHTETTCVEGFLLSQRIH